MVNLLQEFGVGAGVGAAAAAALAAPFVVLTASPGAVLADECKKQAPPPPPPSSRAYITNVSKPTLIADAGPSVAQASSADCPPRDAITVLQERNRIVIDGQRDLRETLRNLPPIPGS
jgi:hypothetical protein